MNGMELLTAVEHCVPVIWIVENNNMHGITYHASKRLSRSGEPMKAATYRRPLEVSGIAARWDSRRGWSTRQARCSMRCARRWPSARRACSRSASTR